MTKKYLLFSMTKRKTGVDNVFRMLNLIFKEARHLDRIPVIGEFTMSPTHNLGDSRADLRFEDYLDLSNGITVERKQGCHRPTAFRLDWIREEELDLTNYSSGKVYKLADDEIVGEEMNRCYDVLIRRDPTFKYVSAYKEYRYGNYLIDFPYSEKVNKLSDEVLGALGISRQDTMAAQHYFLNKVNSSEWNAQHDCIPLDKVYYACMHVRASIQDRDHEQPIFPCTAAKEQIESVLRYAIRKKSQLYIMSDIHQPDFFDFLKSDYRVYRYYDFPNLRRLVSGEGGEKTDNVMLYLVEKNIMKYATVKILPPHKGPMIYNLNTVYDLTLLKKPSSKRLIYKKLLKKPLPTKLFFAKTRKSRVTTREKLNPNSLPMFLLKNLLPKKYLLFSMAERKTGVDNVFRMLNFIFKEARHLNRIPVIGEFTMSPTHNLSNLRADLRFEDYLDLSNSITVKFEQGCHKSSTFYQGWIKEKELNLANYAPDKIYDLADNEIVGEEMNRRYGVLIRRDPTFDYVNTCQKYKHSDYFIDFPYSEKVNRLVDGTLNILGISREEAMTAQHYFINSTYDEVSDEQHVGISLDKVYYACMHVRASIKDRDYEQPIFPFAASKEQIKSVLEHSISKGSRIYIMSDIHRPKFFDFLKSDYRIYRYYDFPDLRKLVSGEGGGKIDNVMLYLVEKNIMKYATVKILPPHKGPMVYHLNTAYDLLFLKEPPTTRERQVPESL